MRGRLKVLCPWAFGVLVVLPAVYGSKGSPLYILHPVSKLSEVRSLPRRLLSLETETPPSLPFGMEVELGPSILAPHEPLKAERPAMVPQHSERASPPHPSDVESTPAAPEGSVPRPPTTLPKSEVLPHNIQSVIPPTQLSPAPDHSSSTAKSERIASPSPSITRHAASSKSLVSPPEPQVVIPPAMPPIFAPGHLTSNMRPKAMIPPSPSVASPPPSVPDSEEQARSGAPGAGFDAKPPTLISSPNVDKVRSGAPIAAPPREEHDNPFPIKHSQPNASSVAPASIASPAIRRNGNALSPPSSHLSPPSNLQPERPVTSPPSAISPDTGKDRHDMPIAASPNPLSSHVNQMNHSHSKDYTISPTPITSPTYRRKHMPVVAPPPSSSPGFDHPNYTHPKGPTVSPIPPMPPVENRRYGMPVAAPPKDIFSHLTPAHHRHEKAISPSPHGVEEPVHDVHAPFSSHSQPPSGNVPARPSSGPVASFHHSIGRGRAGNPTPAPSHLIPWPHHQARPPNYRPNHHAPPPHEQARPPNERPNHSAPPPHEQEPNDGVPASSPSALIPSIHNKSSSPAQSPAPPPHEQEPNDGVPASSPSTLIPSIHNKSSSPAQSPASPPDSISGTPSPSLPQPLPIHALPPPPPNLDCTPLSCAEPLTNSPPGSPCACVMPINVELQLSIGLYTFFPLVSEFAQEIASGVSMKQSQVRVMGANAASEEPEKTIVLVDLVPLKETFDSNTSFQVYEEFWLKHIFINPTYFVDYEVIYVHYPGLPPSPPTAPGNLNFDDGTFGNGNRPKMMHPFAVDVRKQKDKRNGAIIAIVVLSSVIALIVCLAVAWLLIFKCRRHSQLPIATGQAVHHLSAKAAGVGTGSAISGSKKSSASASFSSSIATYTGSAKTFTLAEMERATNKFDDSKIIGEGGFGRVYEGTLDDGMRVAIKILKRDDQQGSREFLAEVEMLSRLHHRNLIKLIGICIEESTRCLVYELVPNGSVESHLHGMDKEITPLDWRTRLKIALGAARGLAYLHEDSSPRVIHRDFKSSNILLEEDFTPKVSDFGLARTALDGGKEYISTRVMGTFGYVAPEYAMTGHLLVKSDVYSYGVVLLELLTGRKPVDMMRPPGQENLVTWARPLLTSKDSLESILDPSLGTTVPFHSMAKVAAIASMCVQPEVDQRPFMGEVVQALKLVFDEENGCGGSGSCTLEDIVQENESGTGLDLETERTLSVYDVFNTSARFLRDMSGSFRRFSSSGPLRPGSKTQYLSRERRVSTGSTSEHGRFGASSKGGKDWM